MTDTQRIIPAPIRKVMRVRASRERAFEVFAAKMGSWWLKDHSVVKQVANTEQADVLIEPREGGRWYEVGANGSEYQWGRVIAWDPPARLVLAWQLNGAFDYDPGFETIVEVIFIEDGPFTEVRFEHRDLERFGEGAASVRESMDGGWSEILAGYERAITG
jgi:uncharacterized protein YndB with AHSA1/START domain